MLPVVREYLLEENLEVARSEMAGASKRWSKEETESLINLVHKNPALWNSKLNAYIDGKKKAADVSETFFLVFRSEKHVSIPMLT